MREKYVEAQRYIMSRKGMKKDYQRLIGGKVLENYDNDY